MPPLLRWSRVTRPILILILAFGCNRYDGPRRGAVEGRVTLGGQPVTEGSIEFMPTGGNKGPVAGGSIQDGHYSVEEPSGPVVGLNQIVISEYKKTGKKVPMPTLGGPGTMVDEIAEAVPARYNQDSELTREIKPGKNTLDFELDSN